MEDPIRFDIWCIAASEPERRRQLEEFLSTQVPNRQIAEIKREIQRSVTNRTPLQVASGLGWKNATTILSVVKGFTSSQQLYQEGLGPGKEFKVSYCEKHNLFHGGSLGCPVCNDFYAA